MASRKNLIRVEYPPIRVRHKGKYTYYEVDCRGHGWPKDQPQQPSFPTVKAATEEAQRVAKLVKEYAADSGSVNEDVRLLDRIRKRLTPYNIDLEDAIDIFIKTKADEVAAQKSALVSKVSYEWYQSKLDPLNPREPDTIYQAKQICNRLDEDFPNQNIGTITKGDVTKALTERDVTNATRKIYLRMYRSFFKFAKEHKYVKDNPCDGIKITVLKPKTLIFENDDILTILGRVQQDEALIPYVALSLFTGLRPHGLTKIEWNDIHLDERKYMYVSQEVSKTVEHHTPLHDNVIEWLKPYVGKTIVIKNLRKRLDKVLEGLPWQKDIFRHTCISYFMGETKLGAAVVSEHFGNSPAVIKKHYQRPVTATATEWFWSLTPTKVKELLEERAKIKI
jgi:integrase